MGVKDIFEMSQRRICNILGTAKVKHLTLSGPLLLLLWLQLEPCLLAIAIVATCDFDLNYQRLQLLASAVFLRQRLKLETKNSFTSICFQEWLRVISNELRDPMIIWLSKGCINNMSGTAKINKLSGYVRGMLRSD